MTPNPTSAPIFLSHYAVVVTAGGAAFFLVLGVAYLVEANRSDGPRPLNMFVMGLLMLFGLIGVCVFLVLPWTIR